MPKYLVYGSYTPEGVRGLLKEGGSQRCSHVKKNIENLGGKMEAFYYAFGGNDLYIIADLPNNVSVAAISLATGASGSYRANVVVLLTPEEVDQAAQKAPSVGYRPPGQ